MHDLIIIGGGPAGLTAAIYAGRYRLGTLLISKITGGAIIGASSVENYPGLNGASGMDLIEKFRNHAESFGAGITDEEVQGVIRDGDHFIVNNKHTSRAILLALGTERRKLNLEGEKKLLGKGLSYCAACDAPLFKDKVAGIVGGSDAAADAALLLSRYAKQVYIIYRKEKLRAEPIKVEQISRNQNISIINNSNVVEVKGENKVEGVVLDTGKKIELEGLFIEIGAVPSTALATGLGVETNEKGFIPVDNAQRTNVKGVYAAGDITTNSNNFWQVITACAEGAIAAETIYMDGKKKD